MKKPSLKIICLLFALIFSVLCFTSCGSKTVFTSDTASNTNAPGMVSDDNSVKKSNSNGDDTSSSAEPGTHPQVKFTMKDFGEFVIELYPEYAPQTVDNFISLVDEGFYDGLTFHRVCDGFMAQGGDPQGNGNGGAANTIPGEFRSNGFAENTLSHQRGVVSMARASDPNSASSQFFICYDDCSFLDGNYAAFGKVISGMENVDAFLEVKRVMGGDGAISSPTIPIVIEKAEVIS